MSSTPEELTTVPGPVRTQGNPFTDDVCTGPFAVDELASVADLHAETLQRLTEAIDSGSGSAAGQPLMMLTAPRAGYGKTHLLGRVAAMTGHQFLLVPLAFRSGDSVSLTTVGRRGMEALASAEGNRAEWTKLRDACCGVCAALLCRMIQSGDLPCANADQALRVLRHSPAEVFDENGAARLIGDWLMQHIAQLRPAMVKLLAHEIPAQPEILGAWLQAMLDQSAEGGSCGVATLKSLLAEEEGEGCLTWLRLLSSWRPVVLLVDHLDGFYRNTDAGLGIAALLLDLADVHGIHVVLSLNQDVWQATFGHHLPSAMEDRLTASQVLLRGLSAEQALSMVGLRLKAAEVDAKTADEFVKFLDVPQYFLGRPLGSVAARTFLRHVANQWEFFVYSAPPPSTALPPPLHPHTPLEGAVPLMTETVELEGPTHPAPPIFDTQTGAQMKKVAEALKEPVAALPQDEPKIQQEHGASDWASTPAVADAASAPEPEATSEPDAGTRSADAFEKLRDMLDRLRQPGAVAAAAATLGGAPVHGRPGVAESATPKPAETATGAEGSSARNALLGRFEALCLQMRAEAESKPLDYTKVAELIRLAGRRFPLVRFSEHELPGMTGRFAMCWSLQGMEILFGLANFSDMSYWRTLAGFAAGRLSDLETVAEREQSAAAKLKLVTFKSERDQVGWQELLDGQLLPETLLASLDLVSLDRKEVASLYAMQRMIKEAESGALEAPPPLVMSVLARELDFFWKRITRQS